jgi:putative tryptophan/tyrosine transport system substrate-binding protein
MTRFFFFILLSSLCFLQFATDTFSQEILVVRNLRIKPYSDALTGFQAVLGGKFGSINYTVLGAEDAASSIRRKKADLVLAIGMDALQAVKGNTDIPIVYLMVLAPESLVHMGKNITGVSMTVSPEKQLAALRKVLPGARRVGLLYDPRKSGLFVKRAHGAAREARIDLLAKEVSHPKAVLEALHSLKGSVDAFWMIPDTTVVTPETAEMIMLFSLENRLPVSTFSVKYLEMGALMSLDINASDMGRQAGELAARILSGTNSRDIPAVEADTSTLFINETVARKLRIPLGDEIRSKARILN